MQRPVACRRGSATTGAATLTATIGALPNGVELQAWVAATVDDNGNALTSAPAGSPKFMAKGKPGAPGSVRYAMVGGGDEVRLNWTPSIELREGLLKTIEYFRPIAAELG